MRRICDAHPQPQIRSRIATTAEAEVVLDIVLDVMAGTCRFFLLPSPCLLRSSVVAFDRDHTLNIVQGNHFPGRVEILPRITVYCNAFHAHGSRMSQA